MVCFTKTLLASFASFASFASVAQASKLPEALQSEVDTSRPLCGTFLDGAWGVYQKSGQDAMVKQLYADYVTSPTGVFVWCADISDPDGEDAVILASPLLYPGTAMEELMTHADNTDEQRQLVYDLWDEHHLNSTGRCCGPEKRFDWYGYFHQEESNVIYRACNEHARQVTTHGSKELSKDGTIDAVEGTTVPNVVHESMMMSERVMCTCTMTGVPPSRNNTVASIVNTRFADEGVSGGARLGASGLVTGVIAGLLLA
jgi:hypothetical protein